MNKRFKAFLVRFKHYLIACGLFTLWFLADPALNLSHLTRFIGQEPGYEPEYIIQMIILLWSARVYILFILLISLTIYALKHYGVKRTGIGFISFALSFYILSACSEFPLLRQVTSVWSYDRGYLEDDMRRYDMLIEYLVGWCIAFICIIAICEFIKYLKTENASEMPKYDV